MINGVLCNLLNYVVPNLTTCLIVPNIRFLCQNRHGNNCNFHHSSNAIHKLSQFYSVINLISSSTRLHKPTFFKRAQLEFAKPHSKFAIAGFSSYIFTNHNAPKCIQYCNNLLGYKLK